MSRPASKLLCLLLCCALTGFGCPLGASAQPEARGIPFLLCDTAAGWGLSCGTLTTDLEEYTEAPASLRYTVDLTGRDIFVIQCVADQPVDASHCTHFEMDLYLDDPALLASGSGQMELTSSGKSDVAELCYNTGYLGRLDLQQGWNHLVLPLDAGDLNSQTEEEFDPSHVNFFRFYLAGLTLTGERTLRLDNMFFTDGQGGSLPLPDPDGYVPPSSPPAADETRYGDVTLDETVDAADALLILQYTVELRTLANSVLQRADVDHSGRVDASDALCVLQHTVNLIDSFAIEKGIAGAEQTEVGLRRPHLVHTVYPTEEAVVAVTDVVAWGARGDGVTDDSLAFRKALAYAEGLGGGTVFVPVGKYVLRSNLAIPNGVTLKGDSPKVDSSQKAEGSILLAYEGRDREDGPAFLSMYSASGVENLSIYYPEQTMGDIRPYPWTIEMMELYGICVQNVRLVNSYRGIKLGEQANALQNIRGVVGTVLKLGLFIDQNVDICRLQNITFTPECWSSSGLSDTTDRAAMEEYVRSSSTGFKIEQVDWTYLTGITVRGSAVGIHTSQSTKRENGGSPNGQMYDICLENCETGFLAEYINSIGMMLTKGKITGKNPVVLPDGFESSLSLRDVVIESEGDYGVYCGGEGAVTLSRCSIVMNAASPKAAVSCKKGRASLLETSFSGEGSQVEAAAGSGGITLVNCGEEPRVSGNADLVRSYQDPTLAVPGIPDALDESIAALDDVCVKPVGDGFVCVSEAPYLVTPSRETDCADALQKAIDDLASRGGGVVYVPAGIYRLDQAITVRTGVELRGSSDAPQHTHASSTTFYTDFARGGEETAPALITLEGRAGVNGFKVMYPDQGTGPDDIVPYAYTIRGEGVNCYVLNVNLINSYLGVDFDTVRCDGHVINGLTGAPLRHGVAVGGGSAHGVVRDVQFNPHYYGDSWIYGVKNVTIDSVFSYQMKHAETFVVRDTKDEFMFNNFVFGALSGLALKDEADVLVLGHGTDGGNQSLTASGRPKKPVTLVNSQLVVTGAYGDIMIYINLAEDFTGELNLVQTNMWGSPNQAVSIPSGTVRLSQGAISRNGVMGVVNEGGSVSVSGMEFKQLDALYDLLLDEQAVAGEAFGNLYASDGGRGRIEDLPGILRGTDY